MNHLKFLLFLIGFSLPLNSYSNETPFENGWTSELYQSSVDSCTASAVNNNMKHIIEKENVVVDSDEYLKILRKVKQHQSAVCKCTQDLIMKEYKFSDIEKILDNKNFIISAAKDCNKKIVATNNK